jgi:addiction module HigA family antidote
MTDMIRNQYIPDYIALPGETLLETLEDREMSQAELAERTGRPVKTINEIIKGKAPITPDTALQLERVLGVPASFWNNLERNYQTDLARLRESENLAEQVPWLDQFPLTQMRKFGWISKMRDKVEQVRELLNFFGVASPKEWGSFWEMRVVSYRQTKAFTWDDAVLAAWLRQGEMDASEIHCVPYRKDKFKAALSEIRSLTMEPDPKVFVPKLQELCAACGVAVVLVPELPKTRISGATQWLSKNKALIQLSLRHKTNDHLWFTFFHEVGHILLHGKKDVFIDMASGDEGEKEDEANKFAGDFLIPKNEYREFADRYFEFSESHIRSFAREIDIAPGIVVGRLQHDCLISFSYCNDLKECYEWTA